MLTLRRGGIKHTSANLVRSRWITSALFQVRFVSVMAAQSELAEHVSTGVRDMVSGGELAETSAAAGGTTMVGTTDANASGVWAAAASIGDPSANRLNELAQRKKRLAAEKDQVARDLRDAERKRIRLVERARGLTDNELMAIIATRATAKAKASAKAKAKANAAPER